MLRRNAAVFLGVSVLSGALVSMGLGACQSSGGDTGGGATTDSTSSSSGSMSTSTSSSGSVTTSSSSGGTGGMGTGGMGTGGAPQTATIHDITTGTIGPKVAVQVNGVVAMSHQFLVSQSKSTGSCLWGVYVSEPNITETAPNSGILVLSYGTPASIPDGGTKAFCPVIGLDPSGSGIPDDTKPGDVLDITGKTDYFINKTCGMTPTDATVAQYQISNVTKAVKTGTATPPTPHLLTDAEIAQLASPTDKTFHDQWGGVKVRIQNVTSVPQVNGDGGTGITDQYGHIVLMGSNLYVGDKNYYQGLLAKTDVCHKGPVYANATTTFTQIDGFSFLDFCTWSLEPENRCVDLQPPSDDCAGNTCP
jgi:hypothetical protein